MVTVVRAVRPDVPIPRSVDVRADRPDHPSRGAGRRNPGNGAISSGREPSGPPHLPPAAARPWPSA